MRIKKPAPNESYAVSAGALRMRDVHFKAALFDATSPIVQRRSGKSPPPPQRPANRLLPLEVLAFQHDCTEPTDILEAGKVMARALAAVVQEDQRLTLAQVFCASVIETYWFESQRHYRSAWSLPDLFLPCLSSELDEGISSHYLGFRRSPSRSD
jgi:hypothetical protein